ncbi:hypothetical protein CL176_02490 [Suicoccus acidiformans]|uniref:Uncharacterized protein n=1 Tax=Suicoccus acidiformans TaxID=2036206 RepID=A0A347WIS7_9LACT|nr:hypothetical protein CL176_02490 [Suicoccus acidiformans]
MITFTSNIQDPDLKGELYGLKSEFALKTRGAEAVNWGGLNWLSIDLIARNIQPRAQREN